MGCDLTMPDRSNESYRTRREILDAYYSEVYQKYLFERDLQGMGIRYFERAVEKFWKIKAPNRVLEIGGGSGEHLPYVSYEPKISYTLLDLRRVEAISSRLDSCSTIKPFAKFKKSSVKPVRDATTGVPLDKASKRG